jgi:hypothetical protein
MVGLPGINDVNGLVMTVIHLDDTPQYVRLANYASDVALDGLSGHVSLDFSVVKAGWDDTDTVDWTTVKRMFLSLVPTTYSSGDTTPLPTEVTSTISLTNIAVTGPQVIKWDGSTDAHSLKMADGYDDSYHLAPKRIVEAAYALGYRDWYNVYMGLSHHHNVTWSETESRFICDPAKDPVNATARAWWDDLVINLVAQGFINIVVSISYEIINYQMPLAWRQLDYAGNPGRSGWDPPSEFISPCNTQALNFLIAEANYLIGRITALGGNPVIQVGEPWWWDGAYGGSGPCFYDGYTTAAYTSETGKAVPTPYLTSISSSYVGHEDYLYWLRQKLGDSTMYILNTVKAANPTAETSILFFTPQIMASPMLLIINLPVDHWKYPNLDILQIEDYDWIIDKHWPHHDTTWNTAFTLLNYPVDKVQYFAGFNLLPEDADEVWPGILLVIRESMNKSVTTFIWARPQVWRDNIIWDDREQISVSEE